MYKRKDKKCKVQIIALTCVGVSLAVKICDGE